MPPPPIPEVTPVSLTPEEEAAIAELKEAYGSAYDDGYSYCVSFDTKFDPAKLQSNPDRCRKYMERSQRLAECASRVQVAETEQDIFDEVTEFLVDAFKLARSSFMIKRPNGTAELFAVTHRPGETAVVDAMGPEAAKGFFVPGMMCHLALKGMGAMYTADASRSGAPDRKIKFVQAGLRCMANIPLITAGDVIGVLNVGEKTAAAFGVEDLVLLCTVATVISGNLKARMQIDSLKLDKAMRENLLGDMMPNHVLNTLMGKWEGAKAAKKEYASELANTPPISSNGSAMGRRGTKEGFSAAQNSQRMSGVSELKLSEDLRQSGGLAVAQSPSPQPQEEFAGAKAKGQDADINGLLSLLPEGTTNMVLDMTERKADTTRATAVQRWLMGNDAGEVAPSDSAHVGASMLYAEVHANITVLFADIVGFTAMCNNCPPQVVFHMLDSLFAVFDNLLDKYPGCFKLDTIGDAYIIAGGIEGGGSQAEKMVELGAEMVRSAAALPIKMAGSRTGVSIRVGVHSGPAVSGVLGTRVPKYSIYGDTVNTASRVEAGGIAGLVHVSDATYKVLSEGMQSVCAPTAGLAAKGKAVLQTYFIDPNGCKETAAEIIQEEILKAEKEAEYQSGKKSTLLSIKTSNSLASANAPSRLGTQTSNQLIAQQSRLRNSVNSISVTLDEVVVGVAATPQSPQGGKPAQSGAPASGNQSPPVPEEKRRKGFLARLCLRPA